MAAAKKSAKRAPTTRTPAPPAQSPHGWIEEPAPAPAATPQWTPAPQPQWSAPPQPRPSGMDDRSYALLLHLSALGGLIIMGFFFLGPLILWMVKKDQSPFIDRHGRSALDFHVSLIIYAVVAFVLVGLITVMTFGIGLILMLPLVFVGIFAYVVLSILFPILAGVKANQGQEYDYPLSLRLFRRRPGQ